MFAREHKHEYDPASSPMIDRPLAAGRPLSIQAQENAYGGKRPEGFRKNIAGESKSSPTKLSTKMNEHVDIFTSPVKTQGSPTKSSLSSKSRYAQAHGFDPENSIWSDEEDSVVERQLPPGKSLHRHAKSVTFDAAPPQVNEYEMTTPDPSSVASGSRDGSHDSTEDESFDRGSSIDREDSFDASLEDTEKTPVVLPEDWRFMSPDMANDDLATHIEDPFDGDCSSPAPTARPSSSVDTRPSSNRTGSASSDGEKRPLPPLPGPNMPIMSHAEINSADSQSVIAESVAQVPIRAASPPRPASITKSEIKGMGGCSMSIEDRLRLMMIQDEETPKVADAEQREQRDRTLDRQSPALKPEFLQFNQEFEFKEDVVEDDDPTSFGNYKLPPRISRESILRKLKTRTPNVETEEDECSSLSLSSGIDACPCEDIDPDMPLPTTEVDVVESEVLIKQEATNEDSPVDVYSIPDLYSQHLQAESYTNAIEKLEAFQLAREAESTKDDDDESRYSVDSQIVDFQDCVGSHETENGAASTPRPSNPDSAGKQLQTKENNRMSLPQFAALLGDQDFGFGMESFMAPSPTTNMEPVKSAMPVESSWTPSPPLNHDQSNEMLLPMVDPEELALERPMTPDEQLQPPRFPGHGPDVEEEPRTPDSVIRHSVASSPAPESPGIPEPVATIKASGSRLKTRPSATPADIKAMAEVRRQVSSEIPSVPQVPQRHQNRPSVVAEASEIFIDPNDESASLNDSEEKDFAKHLKRKSSLVTLDLSVEDSNGLGIESEFDRVIEAQKVAFHSLYFATASQSRSPIHAENAPGESFKPFRENFADTIFRTQKGYLMRQNTKVIIASSASHESAESTAETKDRQEPSTRATRSAGTSPRKPSQSTWTTEPWNGKIRRKSIRQSGGSPSKKSAGGPAPPLPGQESNVASGLGSVNEDEVGLNIDDIGEDGERGRLFVKVVRVKDLDLPLPKGSFSGFCYQKVFELTLFIGERSYFALTLDNGMHCVTTAWLELGRTAPIGQEFELVVLNDLEFQLTLQTKLEEPKAKPIIESPSKAVKVQKPSTFSRVFASPRKRKELELKQQEEAQRAERQSQKEAQAGRRSAQPTAWELLNKLVAKDGSFARSYVSLKDHESNAFGNSYTVDVPCFNEWATEDVNASVKSKRSVNNGGTQRKAPYRVGKLELQLLYIPKPKGVKDEDMPKSMNACIRELKEAESASPLKWEGHLSQQGGDCPVSNSQSKSRASV